MKKHATRMKWSELKKLMFRLRCFITRTFRVHKTVQMKHVSGRPYR